MMKVFLTAMVATVLFVGCSDEWSMDETSDFYTACIDVVGSSYDNSSDACACVRNRYMEEGKTYEEAFETAFASLDKLKQEVESCGATARE